MSHYGCAYHMLEKHKGYLFEEGLNESTVLSESAWSPGGLVSEHISAHLSHFYSFGPNTQDFPHSHTAPEQ